MFRLVFAASGPGQLAIIGGAMNSTKHNFRKKTEIQDIGPEQKVDHAENASTLSAEVTFKKNGKRRLK